MKRKLIFLISIIFFSITPLFAILEYGEISLIEAIDIALKTNPQVQMKKLEADIAKNDVKIANRLQNPSISTFQNIGATAQGNPQEVGADYVIELLKRGKRKNYALVKEAIAKDNKKLYELTLAYEVKKAYIDLLYKKTNLKILNEQKELAKEILEDIEIEYQNNKLPKTDVVQAKIALNRSIMYSNLARSEVISARNYFNAVMNSYETDYDIKDNELKDNFKALLTLSPKDNSLNFEKIKNYTLQNRYDLKIAENEIEAAKRKFQEVKSKLIPDLELEGGYGYETKGTSDSGRFMNGAFVRVGFTNIPLVYQYQPEIKNAQLEIEKAQLKYDDVRIDIIREITDAWEKYTVSKENLNFYDKELLSNSKELLESSMASLDKKEINITNFLVSKKLNLELILGYQEALRDYYFNFAELLETMGVVELKEANL